MLNQNEIVDEKILKTLICNAPISYAIIDEKHIIHYANNMFFKLRNVKKDEAIGQKSCNILNKGNSCSACAIMKAINSNEKTVISRKDILPNGTIRFIDEYAIPLSPDENGVKYALQILINTTNKMLAKDDQYKTFEEIINILVTLLNAKDKYTSKHSTNVQKLSFKIAQAMNLSIEEINEIALAAGLHDIGKVYIPNSILNKNGPLTVSERKLINKHTIYSHDILENLSSFENIRKMVKYHHERLDGSGYPEGLKEDQIPLGAKIIAVADSYDAIISKRVYKPALDHSYAIQELKENVGNLYDKDIVDIFCNLDLQDYVIEPEKKSALTERQLNKSSPLSNKKMTTKTFRSFNLKEITKNVFNNTPCGFVLIDDNKNIVYANNFFFQYTGFTEREILGNKFYGSRLPFFHRDSVIDEAFETNTEKLTRIDTQTINGRKIFDLYVIPITTDNKVDYTLQILIDRTFEIITSQQRQEDFSKLIDNLAHLLEFVDSSDRKELSNQIVSLRDKLDYLLTKV